MKRTIMADDSMAQHLFRAFIGRIEPMQEQKAAIATAITEIRA